MAPGAATRLAAGSGVIPLPHWSSPLSLSLRSGSCWRLGRRALRTIFGKKRLFVNALFNGITLGGLYFLVATGFTLIFGLMRNVNLAHGSLYLFGGYMGYEATQWTGSWLFSYVIAFACCAVVGVAMQFFIFRRMEGRGSATNPGDARAFDHFLRPDGLGLGRQRHPDRHAGLVC